MSDFHPDDTFLRASAYLDGELEAAESARAEADPAVMAEVELLRALQTDVRAVEPPTPGARERAVSAALAAFDALQPAVESTVVVPLRPRPAYTRWLAVAAAVVGIGLLGVIVATAGWGGDGDDADLALDAAADTQFAPAAAEAESSSLAAPLPESLAGADQATAFDAGAPDAAAEAAPATEAPEATMAPAATALAAEASGEATMSTGAPPFDLATPIPDEVTLGIVGRQLLEQANAQPSATTARTTTDAACEDDAEARTILGEGSYLRDDVAVPILIAVDETTAKIVAVDPATCAVVAVEP